MTATEGGITRGASDSCIKESRIHSENQIALFNHKTHNNHKKN